MFSSLKLPPFAAQQFSPTAAAAWADDCNWATASRKEWCPYQRHNRTEEQVVTVPLLHKIKVYSDTSLIVAQYQIAANL